MKLKKWEYGLIAGILLLFSGLAYAQYAYESITVGYPAKSLTAATYGRATRAYITVETTAIRYTLDGTSTPTSAGVGHLSSIVANNPIILVNADEIKNFRAVRSSGADGTIKVTYSSK